MVGFNAVTQGSADAPQPNSAFNADANTDHAFGILIARVGTLRAPALVNWGVKAPN